MHSRDMTGTSSPFKKTSLLMDMQSHNSRSAMILCSYNKSHALHFVTHNPAHVELYVCSVNHFLPGILSIPNALTQVVKQSQTRIICLFFAYNATAQQ